MFKLFASIEALSYPNLMSILRKILITLFIIIILLGAGLFWITRGETSNTPFEQLTGTDPLLVEHEGNIVPTVKLAKPIGWKADEVPSAAEGLAVGRFAEGLDHPRIIQTLPNGDVLVVLSQGPRDEQPGIEGWITRKVLEYVGAAGPSANQIVLLRDTDGDGVAEVRRTLLEGLDSPSGMAWHANTLYVANHNALLSFPYELGNDEVAGEATKVMDLAGGGGHWMRNIILSEDAKRIYVGVGSASNIGERGMEAEVGRAMIWEYNLETGRQRAFAQGLRNPNGLAWSPWTGELWTTVNERDGLGPDLVPDYLTNVPVGAQYGWPWVYWRDNFDRRVDAPIPAYLTEYSRRPEYALGPHVAALGMVFTTEGHLMGKKFSSGAFIARHGSWNRKPAVGYDVVYVEFDDRGNPTGIPVPVLTGFLRDDGDTRGRPTWVEWANDGAMLVSDDTAGIIWRVFAPGAKPGAGIKPVVSEAMRPQRELLGDPRASFGKDDYARIEPAQ